MMMRQRPHVSNNLKQNKWVHGTHLISFHSTSAMHMQTAWGFHVRSSLQNFSYIVLICPHQMSKLFPTQGSWLAIPMQEPRVIRHLHMTGQAMLSPECNEDPAFWEENHRKATAPGFLNYCTSLPF